MRIEVLEYLQTDGKSPFKKWFNRLPAQAAAKVATALLRIEMGNFSAIKWFEGIGEYRIHWGPGLRIYLAMDGDSIVVLLGGGDKSSQDRDIAKVRKLHKEFKDRKAEQK